MTQDIDDLIGRLDDVLRNWTNVSEDEQSVIRESAAALREQRDEIAARSDLMQGYLDCWRNDKTRAEPTMPIELTDEDWRIIDNILVNNILKPHERDERLSGAAEDIAKHFLAAGIERAAKVCEHNAFLYPRFGTGEESSMECAAAIRALLKPLP